MARIIGTITWSPEDEVLSLLDVIRHYRHIANQMRELMEEASKEKDCELYEDAFLGHTEHSKYADEALRRAVDWAGHINS